MYLSVDSMVSRLMKEGLCFTFSVQQTAGDYDSADAEWNYKDVPHLTEVHQNVEGMSVLVSNEISSGIFLQKIGPMRIPLSTSVYSSGTDSVSYFTCFGPFVLLISSKWETINKITTVVTRYHLGSSKLFRPLHFLVHRSLKNNYEILMKADIPMRTRRGGLRSFGYIFLNDQAGYGFLETMNVHSVGVKVPSSLPHFDFVTEVKAIPEGSKLIGDSGGQGVRIVRHLNKLQVFPRICLHEGASLDDAKINDDCLSCPWHGKRIKPIFEIDLQSPSKSYESSGIKLTINDQVMRIEGLFQ